MKNHLIRLNYLEKSTEHQAEREERSDGFVAKIKHQGTRLKVIGSQRKTLYSTFARYFLSRNFQHNAVCVLVLQYRLDVLRYSFLAPQRLMPNAP